MQHFGTANEIFRVRGKKALITGGTKGLGRAMALCLMENGCDVTLVSRNAAEADDMQQQAVAYGVHCYLLPSDITQPGAPASVVRQAVHQMERIDILINAAGMNAPKMLEDMDDDTWDRILDLNLRASFTMMRETVRIMRQQQYGKIVNISSMKSLLGVSDAGYTAYCASKGGINMLTRQVACEVAADGITVNAIAPTFIKTDINARQLDDPVFFNALTGRIPVGRIGQFQDLMGLLLLLCYNASQFITGKVFLLDGGLAARQ